MEDEVLSRVRSRRAQVAGSGPCQLCPPTASVASTEPPGNTYIPAAKAICGTRRRRYTSGPAGPSRSSATVAAARGVTGSSSPACTNRARRRRSSSAGIPAWWHDAPSRSRERSPGGRAEMEDEVVTAVSPLTRASTAARVRCAGRDGMRGCPPSPISSGPI
ncbi:hypothetical protein GCM10022223_56660 [Kineosporia mesophila]|uniref:Uncharacterized protein n=1 Tax=Kineosporia mesophila TaxID=566012 RepID=A0ABP7AFD6_9ACTN